MRVLIALLVGFAANVVVSVVLSLANTGMAPLARASLGLGIGILVAIVVYRSWHDSRESSDYEADRQQAELDQYYDQLKKAEDN